MSGERGLWIGSQIMLKIDDALKLLEPIFANEAIRKIFFDSKVVIESLHEHSIKTINSAEDIKIVAYLLNTESKKYEISDLKLEHGIESNNDAESIYYLYDVLEDKLINNKMAFLYERVEKPLVPVLVEMEEVGIQVDKEKLKSLSTYFAQNIKVLEDEIYNLAGCNFNIASTKQLSEVLFEKMNLANSKQKLKKSGNYSTSSEVLEELASVGHDIASKILQWRQFTKLKNTYTDSLPNKIVNSRIHTNFSNTSTLTGRVNSIEPNLQNIPIRTNEGIKIREAFVAKEGCVLISADYSQIELRIMAHIARVPNLIKDFKEGRDIHTATAIEIFGEANDDFRRKAKAINFGIIYGISDFGLAKQLKIELREAREYIAKYFEKYKEIKVFMDETKLFAKKNGFITTIMNRRIFISNLNSTNFNLRSYAERESINAPLQGSAADIIKKAMIEAHREIVDNNWATRMVLQIHDELIFEVPLEEVDRIKIMLKNKMENVISLELPLVVNIAVGSNWGNLL